MFGTAAPKRSNSKAERVVIGGDTFYFKKLTIGMEEQLDQIVKANQDDTLKLPERPADEADEAAVKAYGEALMEYKGRAAKAFRKLTAEIMRFVLLDETDKPLFAPEDEVYENLNNVYAENFFRAYNKFRQGAEVNPAKAEERFPQ